jgi:hypothetical protein
MSSRAELYRKHARECAEPASVAPDPETKAGFEQAEKMWLAWRSRLKVSADKQRKRESASSNTISKTMIRYVLLAIVVCLVFVVAFLNVGGFLDEQKPQQELKLDLGPQNVDQRPR